jgi:hypothetical protein
MKLEQAQKFLDAGKAPMFRKAATVPVDRVTIAKGGEHIVTSHKGPDGTFVETPNTANPGDRIITRNDDGDVYIVGADKFDKLYTQVGDEFISKNKGYAVHLREDADITPPWGGNQHIKAGGVLFQNADSGERYGNQGETFEADFVRVSADGKHTCPLTISLEDQQEWAEANAPEHLVDIIHRQQHAQRLGVDLQADQSIDLEQPAPPAPK